jgi:ABC-type transport system involved in cytochrome bd biosynthesis fused ATPase/permease subunit
MPDGFMFSALTFPKDASVLDGLDMSVGATESVALFGPNGGGKSSVMRVIAGTAPSTEALAEIAYLPQTPYMFRGTVMSNLVLGLDSDESDHARKLAKELGVDHLLKKPSDEVSVGEAQRVCLARTLASRAPLVLLDEPLAPINAASRPEISGIIKAGTRDRGLLWATHSLEAVRVLADRLIVLDGGIVLQEGSVESVLADPVTDQVAAIIGAG